jgi:tetratricopeptide (TPR) repeat protein
MKLDLAEAYFNVGEKDKAEKIIGTISVANPSEVVLLQLGKMYVELGELEKAIHALNKVTEIPPEAVYIFNKLAIILRKKGFYQESIKQYRRCLTVAKDSCEIRFNLAFLHFKLNQTVKAKELLAKILEIEPDFAPAKTLLQHVQSKES